MQARFNHVREAFTLWTANRIEAARMLIRSGGGLPPIDDASLLNLMNRAEMGVGGDSDIKNLARNLTRGIILQDEEVVRKVRSQLYSHVAYSDRCLDLIQREAAKSWKVILEKEGWQGASFLWHPGGGAIRIYPG